MCDVQNINYTHYIEQAVVLWLPIEFQQTAQYIRIIKNVSNITGYLCEGIPRWGEGASDGISQSRKDRPASLESLFRRRRPVRELRVREILTNSITPVHRKNIFFLWHLIIKILESIAESTNS